MIATFHTLSAIEYYLLNQRSMRHPNDHLHPGVEPDGVWWNPSALFNFSDDAKVNAKDFNRLYHGFDPITGEKLTRTAGSKNRSPGIDIVLNADKSVSTLWAIAPPVLRVKLERAQEDAARQTLRLTIARYCANTRHGAGGLEVVPADILAALWQHGESRAGDPHLRTHCTLFNLARSHKDGQFRTLFLRPIFRWVKAVGAVYGNRLTWFLQQRLGICMERYGDTGIRIAGIPKALEERWSKRQHQIKAIMQKPESNPRPNHPHNHLIQRTTTGSAPTDDLTPRHIRWCNESADIDHDTLLAAIDNDPQPQTRPTPATIQTLNITLDQLPRNLPDIPVRRQVPYLVRTVSRITATALLDEPTLASDFERVIRLHSTYSGLPRDKL